MTVTTAPGPTVCKGCTPSSSEWPMLASVPSGRALGSSPVCWPRLPGATTCRREPWGIIASTNGVLMSIRRPDVRSIRSTDPASSPGPRIVVAGLLRPASRRTPARCSLTQTYFPTSDYLRLFDGKRRWAGLSPFVFNRR
jgi:hypothetical protein